MNIVKRKYQSGDEVNINKLYNLITSRNRSLDKYRWEWIDTWKGQGSMWLAFDADREKDDQLVMQYSLIPTPFSFWGKSYLAGKTENCMCHPDFRGKGQFFLHEKESFEEAKENFNLFFTTTGNMTGGAVGAVRRKLGYVAFDDWVQYVFCLNSEFLFNLFFSKLKKRNRIPVTLAKFLSRFVSRLFSLYFKFVLPPKPSADIRIFNKSEVPLDEIESFWNRNKTSYMITVDRQSAYLAWRINRNPDCEYQYLLYYKENHLVGYAIVSLSNENVCMIEDLLVENKDAVIFETMISSLLWYAGDRGANAVSCQTLIGNMILKAAFKKSKFINLEILRRMIEHRKGQKQFHVYLSSEIESKQNPLDPQNWYVTALFSEGRNS